MAAAAPPQENVWVSKGPTGAARINDIAVADSAAYAATYNGVFRSLRSGAVAVDMTTTEPSLAIEIATASGAKGAAAVDAPVSGGDVGARHLIAKHTEAVAEVPVDGQSAFLDIDTPQALEAARRDYGVVIEQQGRRFELDSEATSALRRDRGQ